ncbi:ATP-binding protein [Streptosporangium lutulentum]
MAVRQWQITAALRNRNALLTTSLRIRDEEIRHLAGARLPALVESLHQNVVAVPGPLYEQLMGSEYGNNLESVVDQFTQSLNTVQARAGQSVRAALMAAMRALQGLASEQQLSISAMQDRHDHPQVLQDLLEIDHANAQFGRRAQVIAVLCGAWPGRQRAASTVEDVVRGATSRIRDYRRVRVHAQIDTAVIGRVVEPVVLAVAELLDNAARHSQPNTSVEVNIHAMHNGAVIVVDDGGVGMHDQETRQATSLLSGEKAVDVTRLGDPLSSIPRHRRARQALRVSCLGGLALSLRGRACRGVPAQLAAHRCRRERCARRARRVRRTRRAHRTCRTCRARHVAGAVRVRRP